MEKLITHLSLTKFDASLFPGEVLTRCLSDFFSELGDVFEIKLVKSQASASPAMIIFIEMVPKKPMESDKFFTRHSSRFNQKFLVKRNKKHSLTVQVPNEIQPEETFEITHSDGVQPTPSTSESLRSDLLYLQNIVSSVETPLFPGQNITDGRPTCESLTNNIYDFWEHQQYPMIALTTFALDRISYLIRFEDKHQIKIFQDIYSDVPVQITPSFLIDKNEITFIQFMKRIRF